MNQIKILPHDENQGRRMTLYQFMLHAIRLNSQSHLEKACYGRRGWRYVLASAAIAGYNSCRCMRCFQRHIFRGAQIQQDHRLRLLLPGYILALSDIGYQPLVRS